MVMLLLLGTRTVAHPTHVQRWSLNDEASGITVPDAGAKNVLSEWAQGQLIREGSEETSENPGAFTRIIDGIGLNDSEDSTKYVSPSYTASNGYYPPYFPDLNSAINNSGSGATIVVYPGTYVVFPVAGVRPGMKVSHKDSITISGFGANSVVYADSAGDMLLLNACTNIKIQGMTFKSSKPARVVPNLFGMVSMDDTCSGVTVENCSFIGGGDHGITNITSRRMNTTNVLVENNYFYGGGSQETNDGSAITVNGKYYTVRGNYIDGWYRGIEIEGNDNARQDTIRNVSVEDNTLLNVKGHGILVLTSTHVADEFTDIMISNNTVRNGGSGSSTVAIFADGGKRITVENNSIATINGLGISLNSTQSDLMDVTISGNTVDTVNFRGIQVANTNTLFSTVNVTIGTNTVEGAHNSGILVSRCSSVTINDNICANNSVTSGSVGAGIDVADSLSSSIIIRHNLAYDNLSTKVQEYGIWIEAGVPNSVVVDNTCFGNKLVQIYDQGVGTQLMNNRETEDSLLLPVEIASISAAAQEEGVLIEWSTSTEINNFGFDVERSSEPPIAGASTWIKLVFVPGSGTSEIAHDYSYIDKRVAPGRYFYRIRQINRDGSSKYSDSVAAVVGNPKLNFSLEQNYPNPFNPTSTIEFVLPKKALARLEIFDLRGHKIATLLDAETEAGEHRVSFDCGHLSSGVYLYRLSSGSLSETRKFVLLK